MIGRAGRFYSTASFAYLFLIALAFHRLSYNFLPLYEAVEKNKGIKPLNMASMVNAAHWRSGLKLVWENKKLGERSCHCSSDIPVGSVADFWSLVVLIVSLV